MLFLIAVRIVKTILISGKLVTKNAMNLINRYYVSNCNFNLILMKNESIISDKIFSM